ncbi:hypothetical protein HanHA89_Chr13g0535801 [Helianthus annuus]|nr:hypothetical protein HanHA89_Chr13g0535801 [Helianthus annuus]
MSKTLHAPYQLSLSSSSSCSPLCFFFVQYHFNPWLKTEINPLCITFSLKHISYRTRFA